MKILLAIDDSKFSQAAVQSVVDQVWPPGTEVKVLNVLEPPSLLIGREMAGYDPEWRTDLIVLGSHGQKGLNRFLMGSVSEAVVRHAHCSVEIVRNPA